MKMPFEDYSIALEKPLEYFRMHNAIRNQVPVGRSDTGGFEISWAVIDKALRQGATWYLSDDIHEMIVEAGGASEILSTILLDELLFTSSGFLWLPSEHINGFQQDGITAEETIQALVWTTLSGSKWSADKGLTFDIDQNTGQVIEYSSEPEKELWVGCVGFVSDQFITTGTIPWHFGQTLNAACLRANHSGDTAWLRMITALMLFNAQELTISRRERVARATRRRLRLPEPESMVNVIRLRRRKTSAEVVPASDSVEYHWRWIVHGHWRHQWYPSLNAHQPKWIMPYVKGPEDRPLKSVRPTVFAVVR